jgi:hypothetical protein
LWTGAETVEDFVEGFALAPPKTPYLLGVSMEAEVGIGLKSPPLQG